MKHLDTYSIRNCPLCDAELKYDGKNHKKTSREAERKQRSCKSCSTSGQNNPMYGKPAWSKGKKRPKHSKWLKENNPMFDQQYRDKYFLAQFGMTAEQWAETKDERYLYILEVLRVTKKQPLHTFSFVIRVVFVVNSWSFCVKFEIITTCLPNAHDNHDKPLDSPTKNSL